MSKIPAQRSEDIAIGCSCGTGTCEDCAREMRGTILAVRQLHRPVKPHPRGLEVCEACTSLAILREPVGTAAARSGGRTAGVAWPCATIRLLDRKGAPLAYGPSATA